MSWTPTVRTPSALFLAADGGAEKWWNLWHMERYSQNHDYHIIHAKKKKEPRNLWRWQAKYSVKGLHRCKKHGVPLTSIWREGNQMPKWILMPNCRSLMLTLMSKSLIVQCKIFYIARHFKGTSVHGQPFRTHQCWCTVTAAVGTIIVTFF